MTLDYFILDEELKIRNLKKIAVSGLGDYTLFDDGNCVISFCREGINGIPIKVSLYDSRIEVKDKGCLNEAQRLALVYRKMGYFFSIVKNFKP